MANAENAAKILNYIKQDASTYYKNYVPKASVDADNIKQIGAVIMGDATLRNEFISSLVNRIGFVTLTNRIWENPWAVFNKGLVEYGTTVEEIFVDLAKPFEYNAEAGVDNQYKRQIPDVKAAFHVLNWQKFFKVKPEVFTAEEKRAWLDKNTDVALGSDAFFPFGDNVERAKRSGVKYIAQPGGSIRDDNVIETCNKYNMAMCFTGIRLFHH